MDIFGKLDLAVDACPNPKMILLGTDNHRELVSKMRQFPWRLQVEMADKYMGVPVVVVEGRTELIQVIPGDEECVVRGRCSDFMRLLTGQPVSYALRNAIKKSLKGN